MKNECSGQVVYTQMKTRQRGEWRENDKPIDRYIQNKRRLRNIALSMAAVFCLGIGAINLSVDHEKVEQVMSHVTADFEYDDTLGRLQFVSNILPDSAMVFLESGDSDVSVFAPINADVTHAWNHDEPWLEYRCAGDVKACSSGDIMTVVRNHDNEYTVRIVHDAGYESVYSGLSDVTVAQFDSVQAGERIGSCEEWAAFELRKDGLSVMPQFDTMGG